MRIASALIAAAGCAMAAAAPATTLQASPGAGGYRAAAVDPDARLEAVASAASRTRGDVHPRTSKADRSIIKNDPQLRAAFAWMSDK